MIWLALLLVTALGYANQRGSTCAVSAADEIIEQRSFHRLAGFLVVGSVSAAMLFALGSAPRMVAVPGWAAMAGGVIGGLGVALNGRCAMGTIASLGRGRIDRLATLVGFFLGAVAVLDLLGLQAAVAVHDPSQSWVYGGLATAVSGTAWYLARSRTTSSPGWMGLIGFLNAVLAWMMVNWSYTGGLTRLASGMDADVFAFLVFLAVLLAGSFVAAVRAGTFKTQQSLPRDWSRSGLGGFMLGAGSALVPGSNDAMLLVGVPLVVPGLLQAYVSFWVALVLARALRKIDWPKGAQRVEI